jgi:16S rRNA (adenine1518-N6/adenine1519-N6)-dimethyltransferase
MQAHSPRKRFGQNFLRDQAVIQRIIAAFAPAPGQSVVEIGPGLGALTAPLLEILGEMDAVELDRDLILRLQQRFPRLRLHQGDALRFDFSGLAAAGQLRVIGNLPYNISTPLLFHLLDQAPALQDMLFMLQREVVERIAAAPGDADYGRLSVMAQYRCHAVKLFIVPPEAFDPRPQVESMIIHLTPRRAPPVEVGDEQHFAELVRQAFSQRRKTLRNSLSKLAQADDFSAAGIDPSARPETLSLAEFAALARQIQGR